MPPGMDYIWTWFHEITFGLQGSITAADVTAWQSLTGLDLEPWELDAIRRLDLQRRKKT